MQKLRANEHVPVLTPVSPKYKCSKGHITDAPLLLQITEGQRVISRDLCPYCYFDWYVANIPEVKEIEV